MKKINYYAADTESTNFNNERTEVWAAGICKICDNKSIIEPRTEETIGKDLKLFNSIDKFVKHLGTLDSGSVIYFHNLKHDFSFIQDYLSRQGYLQYSGRISEMPGKTMISTLTNGEMYQAVIKINHKVIIFRDSYKLIPFKLDKITKDFKVKHQKLTGSIDYNLERPEGWEMSEEEKAYISNDIIGLAESLFKFFNILPHGLNSITIGQICMKEFKEDMGKGAFGVFFPQLPDEVSKFIRKTYKGGLVYIKNPSKLIAGVNGHVYDVNSLYPYVMHKHDKNIELNGWHNYPIGLPLAHLTKEKEILKRIEERPEEVYFLKVYATCEIKPGRVPFITIPKLQQQEGTETSEGTQLLTKAEAQILYLNSADYEHFKDAYNNITTIEEAYFFKSTEGLFDSYIDEFIKLKQEAEIEGNGALRMVAKLLLNNLGGKFGTNSTAMLYNPRIDPETNKITYTIEENEKKEVYVPVASMMTGLARAYICKYADANFESLEYIDTDSLHLTEEGEVPKGDKDLGYFKHENSFNFAKFIRQKCYIEAMQDDTRPEACHLNIKAAGMSETAKMIFISRGTGEGRELKPLSQILNEFDEGMEIEGNLKSKLVQGGRILKPTTFKIHQL